MNKRYLESLSESELKTIIAYNNDLRNMLEEKYIWLYSMVIYIDLLNKEE